LTIEALSAPDVPQEARNAAVERAADGDHVSKADADEMVAKAIEAEREKFEGLVAELQAAADETLDGPPTIPTLVEQLCQATGKKKLKPAQLQHLACILGTATTDGSKVYAPSTIEETRHGASFDRETEQHAADAGLEIIDSRYVVDDLLRLVTPRASAVS
jgi:hypothetical protein